MVSMAKDVGASSQYGDLMFTLLAQYDPVQGLMFRWWANHVYFAMDNEVANEMFVELKEFAVKQLEERGLIAKRDGEFHGLH